MTPDIEDQSYGEFLETFDPNDYPILMHASSEPYVHDDFAHARLIQQAQSDGALLERTQNRPGKKTMTLEEARLRCLDFFTEHQLGCSQELRERLLEEGISDQQVDVYMRAFAYLWVDGRKRRLDSPEMQSIMASVAEHDRVRHPDQAGVYVANAPRQGIVPLFTPSQMVRLFDANSSMLEVALHDYFQLLDNDRGQSINRTYVRRGMYCEEAPVVHWKERYYLSSYSLSTTVPEQFSQTHTSATKGRGFPTIVSTPIPTIQHRIVAFAGFIQSMDLNQMELVIAPPVSSLKVTPAGCHGTSPVIAEYLYE